MRYICQRKSTLSRRSTGFADTPSAVYKPRLGCAFSEPSSVANVMFGWKLHVAEKHHRGCNCGNSWEYKYLASLKANLRCLKAVQAEVDEYLQTTAWHLGVPAFMMMKPPKRSGQAAAPEAHPTLHTMKQKAAAAEAEMHGPGHEALNLPQWRGRAWRHLLCTRRVYLTCSDDARRHGSGQCGRRRRGKDMIPAARANY